LGREDGLGGMKEREAVARLKRGEIEGLEPLVHRHHLRAVRAAYLIDGDLGLAEEIVAVVGYRHGTLIDAVWQVTNQEPFGRGRVREVMREEGEQHE
jgi:hypothetical protein